MARGCWYTVLGLLVAGAVAGPAPAGAQSLAAVAGQTRAASERTYTNADLVNGEKPATAAATPPSPAEPAESTPAKPPAKGPVYEEDKAGGYVNVKVEAETNQAAQDEAYWRRVTKTTRDRIAQAEADMAKMDAQLAAGANGERQLTARDRENLTALRARRQRDAEQLRLALEAHLNRAKALGVPAEFLR